MTDRRPPILGTVTPGLERYCPLLAQQLDAAFFGRGHTSPLLLLPSGAEAANT